MAIRTLRSVIRLSTMAALVAISLMAGFAPLASTAAGCGPVAGTPGDGTAVASPVAQPRTEFPVAGGDITVLAAASLTEPLTEIAAMVEERFPNVRVNLSFAGSPALVEQVRSGAPADVLVLADFETMASAAKDGLVAGEPSIFARNRMAIIVPEGNPAGITGIGDLGRDGVRLVLAAPEVPAGKYAAQVICNAAGGDAPWVEAVSANVVSFELNVKAVVGKVALGEADAGIVYATDRAEGTELVAIPDDINVVAEYPVAAVAGGQGELADAFISYLLGSEAQAVLGTHGFLSGTGR